MFIVLGYNQALNAAAIGTPSGRPFASEDAAEKAKARLQLQAQAQALDVRFLVMEVTPEGESL